MKGILHPLILLKNSISISSKGPYVFNNSGQTIFDCGWVKHARDGNPNYRSVITSVTLSLGMNTHYVNCFSFEIINGPLKGP